MGKRSNYSAEEDLEMWQWVVLKARDLDYRPVETPMGFKLWKDFADHISQRDGSCKRSGQQLSEHFRKYLSKDLRNSGLSDEDIALLRRRVLCFMFDGNKSDSSANDSGTEQVDDSLLRAHRNNRIRTRGLQAASNQENVAPTTQANVSSTQRNVVPSAPTSRRVRAAKDFTYSNSMLTDSRSNNVLLQYELEENEPTPRSTSVISRAKRNLLSTPTFGCSPPKVSSESSSSSIENTPSSIGRRIIKRRHSKANKPQDMITSTPVTSLAGEDNQPERLPSPAETNSSLNQDLPAPITLLSEHVKLPTFVPPESFTNEAPIKPTVSESVVEDLDQNVLQAIWQNARANSALELDADDMEAIFRIALFRKELRPILRRCRRYLQGFKPTQKEQTGPEDDTTRDESCPYW